MVDLHYRYACDCCGSAALWSHPDHRDQPCLRRGTDGEYACNGTLALEAWCEPPTRDQAIATCARLSYDLDAARDEIARLVTLNVQSLVEREATCEDVDMYRSAWSIENDERIHADSGEQEALAELAKVRAEVARLRAIVDAALAGAT